VSDWYGVRDAACPLSTRRGGGGRVRGRGGSLTPSRVGGAGRPAPSPARQNLTCMFSMAHHASSLAIVAARAGSGAARARASPSVASASLCAPPSFNAAPAEISQP
jgi:hypothetical protein